MRKLITGAAALLILTLAACGGGGGDSGGGDDDKPTLYPDLVVEIDGEDDSDVYLQPGVTSVTVRMTVANHGAKAPKLPFTLVVKKIWYDQDINYLDEEVQETSWTQPLPPREVIYTDIPIYVEPGLVVRFIVQAKNLDDSYTSDNVAAITLRSTTPSSNG